jgi:hypothetical protein
MRSSHGTKRIIGFFAAGRPGIVEAWRPREEDPEECGPAEADRRYKTLVRLMLAGEIVDELRPVSVHEQDVATGEYLRITTRDGCESVASKTTNGSGAAILLTMARAGGRFASPFGARRSEGRRSLS